MGQSKSQAERPGSGGDWLERLRSRESSDFSCCVCGAIQASDSTRLRRLIEGGPPPGQICALHASRLVELGAAKPGIALAVSALFEALVSEAQHELENWHPKRVSRVERWLGRVPWRSDPPPEQRSGPACPLCHELERDEIAVSRSLASALTRPEVRAALAKAPLPCWRHLELMLLDAPLESTAWIRDSSRARLEHLADELRDYVWKSDWNRRDLPRGEEQRSPAKALHFLGGTPGLAGRFRWT